MDSARTRKKKHNSTLTHGPIWRRVEAWISPPSVLLMREKLPKEHHIVLHVRANTIFSSMNASIFLFFDRSHVHDILYLRVGVEARHDLLLL
jgi:hypothetical protein